MKTLIIGTTNPAKIKQIRDALLLTKILVESVEKLPEIKEDGTTAQENARKKAVAYSKALSQPVLSMDNALFFDGLPPEKQPGIHVRRIGGGFAATDEELLAHAIALVKSLGGEATAYWEYGVCIAFPNGSVFETTIRTPRIFTSKRSEKMIEGYPLESIQIDHVSGMYISEMSDIGRAQFWQNTLGTELCEFVRGVMK